MNLYTLDTVRKAAFIFFTVAPLSAVWAQVKVEGAHQSAQSTWRDAINTANPPPATTPPVFTESDKQCAESVELPDSLAFTDRGWPSLWVNRSYGPPGWYPLIGSSVRDTLRVRVIGASCGYGSVALYGDMRVWLQRDSVFLSISVTYEPHDLEDFDYLLSVQSSASLYVINPNHSLSAALLRKDPKDTSSMQLVSIQPLLNSASAQREKRLATFSPSIRKLIREHKVRVGMSSVQARLSWGKPDHINQTIGPGGKHEQWVYDSGNYLYFENGILTTIQN